MKFCELTTKAQLAVVSTILGDVPEDLDIGTQTEIYLFYQSKQEHMECEHPEVN